MSWQAELKEAARQAEERRGRMEPWWVIPDGGITHLWATTPEHGEGWTLCAVARALYSMRETFRVERSTDPKMVRVTLDHEREHLAVEESDMALVMASVRLTGLHGRYRKAGTDKEYRF